MQSAIGTAVDIGLENKSTATTWSLCEYCRHFFSPYLTEDLLEVECAAKVHQAGSWDGESAA